jgi:hypothetical protein
VRKTVAVMQPYFFPYAGYFSLIHAVDHFVMFDCVQFPRRGWVHRNRVLGPGGAEEWLTLPLSRQPREVTIRDLSFAADAEARLAEQLRRYLWFERATGSGGEFVRSILSGRLSTPLEFLVESLQGSAGLLGLQPELSRSSELGLNPMLKGQERVIAATKAVGGTHYVNLSGGVGLYAPEAFRRHGLQLSFLRPYVGSHWSFLYRLATEDLRLLAREVAANAGSYSE